MVTYKIVSDYPAYRVGDDGSIWCRYKKIMLLTGRGSKSVMGNKWKKMKLHHQTDRGTEGRSYMTVRLSYDGKSKSFRVHRLVLAAFIGPCPKGMECRHLDGDPTNNVLTNLCWGTAAQNTEDKKKHGRQISNARYYTHEGQTHILKDWAKIKGIPYLTLWNRLNTGLSFADAISIKRYDRKTIAKQQRQPSL